jgi:riboflavin kinase/FMN adenylyltransferase
MAMAARLLGRPFKFCGKVVKGTGIGKTIGFPTANLELPDLVIPARGVYPCKVLVRGKRYRGAVNIGIGPTFEKAEIRKTIEIHLVNFDGDLYGQDIEIEFDADRIRHEIKFSSVEDLKKQILQDLKTIEEFDRSGKTI